MYLTHLSLRNFRSYRELELELVPGLLVFHGGNGQGKSNFLEAVYLLALTKSHRAESDREVIRLQALEESPYTRIVGAVQRKDGSEAKVQVDMALPPPDTTLGLGARTGPFQKRIRVNGVPRLASTAVGTINAVLFSAEDINLVLGSPAGRRRFLDVLLSQIDRTYLRVLQEYQKVLVQRNHLLRRIGEGQARPQELLFWDGELCTKGARIVLDRGRALSDLASLAARAYRDLVRGDEELGMSYQPSADLDVSAPDLVQRMQERLEALRPREVRLGQTLVGPHRDELKLLLDGLDVATYASRGQMRSVALALRLAEARLLARLQEEEPILLLDDVLSEMDTARQEQVLEAACQAQQAIMTVVEMDQHPALAARAGASYQVRSGAIEADDPLSPRQASKSP